MIEFCTCVEGRCFWCTLLVVGRIAIWVQLEVDAPTPLQTPDPGEGKTPSFWSGA